MTAARSRDAIPFDLPERSPADKRRARRIYKLLLEQYPDVTCALSYRSPHELLVATILSAQATDVSVNKATPSLFKAFPTPADYIAPGMTPERIQPYIQTIGLFRNKAKAVYHAMKDVVERYDGEVPHTMEELVTLRGVARKTANVVLGNAFGINVGVVVDTHIARLAKRFSFVAEDATTQMIERHLMTLFPRDSWCMLSHVLIHHGRAVCRARGALCADDPICRKHCKNAAALLANAPR
ncbi:MAG: endonuclease III [Phycisphaerales bacterium]|nr:endonuclease III [Phycisphaerales bacterium]